MTPEDGAPRELTPDEDESVRRLLAAGAAEPEPLPPHVADRLDDVLRGLVAEREGDQAPEAEPRRDRSRPRRWPALLAAAAVVSAVAVGVGQLVGSSGPGGTTTSSSVAGGQAARAASPGHTGPQYSSQREALGPLTTLHTRTFAADAQRAADARFGANTSGTQPDRRKKQLNDLAGSPAAARRCALPDLAAGDRAVAALLDGHRATLVFRAPTSGTREAEVYACDDPKTPLDRARVHVR